MSGRDQLLDNGIIDKSGCAIEILFSTRENQLDYAASMG